MNRVKLFWIYSLFLTFFYSHALVSRSIGLIVGDNLFGDREFAERVRIAAERLQWKIEVIPTPSFNNLSNHYDWVLTFAPGKTWVLENDYLILFDPMNHYFDRNGHLDKKYCNYTGYLATYKNRDLLKEDINNKKNIYPKRWYPTVHYRPYRQVLPTRLFYFMGLWGDRYHNKKYQTLQKELAKKPYTNFFGHASGEKLYGKAYKGSINFDGESVIDRISQMGVCLVLHSEIHLKYEIPSGRIFEAAAASAVIISDQNSFVMEHFGDSVLYVNQELSGEKMFEQIDAHMSWIQNHPKEALEMAKRAHQIFEDNFLLESQLLDFDKFHSEIVLKDSNRPKLKESCQPRGFIH